MTKKKKIALALFIIIFIAIFPFGEEQPIKYIEFPISICFGSLVFAEKLNIYMIFGVIFIFCATIFNKSFSFDD